MQDNIDTSTQFEPDEHKDQAGEMFVMPVSFSQQRLWLLDQLTIGGSQYNIPRAFHLTGKLDRRALRASVNDLIDRHEVLRTCFKSEQGQPVQVISANYILDIPVTDLRYLPEDERQSTAMELVRTAANKPFNLLHLPLIRVELFCLGDNEHVLLINIHHIIADGWSMSIIYRELSKLYEARTKDECADLPELIIQYADYSVWQQEWLQNDVLERQLTFWRQQLQDVSVLDLPTDHPRPAVQTLNGADVNVEIPGTLVVALRTYCQKQGVTMFMTLLAALNVLLHRYSHQDDIVIGSPMAGRNRPEVEGLIGFFINALVLRSDLSGDPDFNELVSRVKNVCLDAYTHQDIPFEKLVEKLQAGRDLSRNPIFQVALVLQNTPEDYLQLPNVNVTEMELPQVTSKFDLTLSLREYADGITGTLNYNSDLFERPTVERMMDHFRVLLESAISSAEVPISSLPMEGSHSRQLSLPSIDNLSEYPRDLCVHQYFEKQVELMPDAIALQFARQDLSYHQLNERANQLAHYLIEQGVEPRALVCLSLSRSMDLIISMLAILKAGATYVPLDDSYPQERLLYMIEDTHSSCLLTETALLEQFENFDGQIICIDSNVESITQCKTSNPVVAVDANDLAYIMYTSGSTGQPKGVEIRHRGIMRLVCNTNYANLDHEQRHLLLAPVSFDASTFEIWGALLNGASCTIYPERIPTLQGLQQTLSDYRITTLWLTSSLFNMIVDEAVEILEPVKQLLVGGEALSVPHIRRALKYLPGTQLINGYGPTENTTFTCTYKIPGNIADNLTSIPIGQPVSNTQVYILDEHRRPVVAGVPGELYIGGDGLARGYLNKPDITAEKFVADPFSTDPDARLYKTGDRVRYLPDGLIDFIGRVDQQVKIRGFRIEPGEIETRLTLHADIQKSVVRVFESGRGKELVAYIESTLPELDENDIKAYLASQLPEYMIPARIIVLEQLPITRNGKVDYHKLPPVNVLADHQPQPDSKLSGDTEQTLADIWSELLDRKHISRYDNFFTVGGHSLLATQLVSRVRTKFDLDIPLKQVFLTPTIAGLASFIDQSHSHVVPSRKGIDKQARTRCPENRPSFQDQIDSGRNSDEILNTTDDIETRLITIWEKVLSQHDVDRNSHFFEIGGHSLTGVKLAYEIDKAFNVQLPLATLFEHPVLHQLAEAIAQNNIETENETMVAVKATGSRKPFFCIHGRAEALVRYMDEDQPFYWLHHKQDGKNNKDFSVEEIARLHLRDIKSVQPEGPYNLAGFSIGGMLACEIAHQLEQAGEQVALLTLFDPTPPRVTKSFQSRVQKLTRSDGRITPQWIARKVFKVLRGRWHKLRYKVKTVIDNNKIKYYQSRSMPLPPDLNVSYWVQLFKNTARNYHYPVCHSKMVIFIPEGQPHLLPDRLRTLRYRWQSVAAGGLDIRVISGCARHSHIVEEPYVQDLMKQLNAIFDDIHGK